MKKIIYGALVLVTILGLIFATKAYLVTFATFSITNDILASSNENKTFKSSQAESPLISDTDSIQTVAELPVFKKHGFEFKEEKEVNVKLGKDKVLEKVKNKYLDYYNEATKVSTVLTKLTNKNCPNLPESNIVLNDYPAWVVTLHGINIQFERNPGAKDSVSPVLNGEKHIILDANTGEEIFSIDCAPYKK